MARHIAQRPGSKVKEATPTEWQVIVAVGTVLGDAQPQFPIETVRYGRACRSLLNALGPRRTIGPGVHFGDISDYARPDHLGTLPGPLVRVALVPHLCRDVVFLGRFRQFPALPNRVSQWLLHIDVLSAFHCGQTY